MKTALTIGFFDGVHIGHQALLTRLRKEPHTTIFTFSNPNPPQLISLEEKLSLLRPYADELIVVPFTLEFAKTPFEKFLSSFNLSYLLLGEGAAFGNGRKGDEKAVKSYAKLNGFVVEYFPKTTYLNEVVSSSRIRKALEEKNFDLANALLGRK
jgi:riboflavin kinase / FMN adenylyltransferase